MTLLSKQQEQTLLAEVIKRTGPRPGLPEFVDQVLILLEDIPGFESADETEVATLIANLSRTYRDQYRKSEARKTRPDKRRR